MEKTLVQQLTSATLKVSKNPQDAEAAELMTKLAGAVGPKWVQANKPAALSPTRTAVVNGWIIQAGSAPVLAAADATAPKALVTLMAILDGDVVKEQGWLAYAMGGDIVPTLGTLAAVGDGQGGQGQGEQGQGEQGQGQGGQQGQDLQKDQGGSGGAIGLAIGLGVVALVGIGVAVTLSGKKKRRAA